MESRRVGLGSDASVNILVPSKAIPDAREALRSMLDGATWLHGAIAFATQRGVDILAELLNAHRPDVVRIVVRGAPITEPQAVLALDELGAEVRVVMGADAPRFHPKLWITRTATETWVLSGSGNLTEGGLTAGGNVEQFELLRLAERGMTLGREPAGSNKASIEHLSRWRRFYDLGIPLRDALSSPAWAEWEAQLARRKQLMAELASLDDALASVDTGGVRPTAGATPSDRALSATTERATVERWMKDWFPDQAVRAEVWSVLADVIEAAHGHRPNAWVACAIHRSRHDHLRRLEILCGEAQAFVVYSDGRVGFEAPPEDEDGLAHEAALRAARMAGARVDWWGRGDFHHPQAIVPATEIPAAREDGLQAVTSYIKWRAPKQPDGRSPHAEFHCPALVEAGRRATGRQLPQPDYST